MFSVMLAAVSLAYRILFTLVVLAILFWTYRRGFPTASNIQERFRTRYGRSVADTFARTWQILSVISTVGLLVFLGFYLATGFGG